ncbi:MAG: hypothetical protein ACOX8L_02800 [Candidatus Methanomethylophilaceae archaeon]|jgi:hypothetical protein
MTDRPKIVKKGFALGIIGGIIAFIGIIDAFDFETAAIVGTCVNMLVSVLFFAAGGMFWNHGPGNWGSAVFLAALATASAIGAVIYGSLNVWIGAILTVIGVAVIFIAANARTGRWISTDRLA